jgi:hypothetical protein
MERPRYLPASRAKAASLRLGRLTVRASSGREIGKLLGFIIDTRAQRVRSLILVAPGDNAVQLEVEMTQLQLDAATRSLRIIDADAARCRAFSVDSIPHVDVADLWVPLFDTAA